MIRLGIISLAALSLLAAGCAVGVEPPAPTNMVRVDGAASFWYGPLEPCVEDTYGNALCKDELFKEIGTKGNPWPPLRLKVDTFHIDAHEVSNHQYEFCVAVGECTAPAGANGPLVDVLEDYYAHPDGTYDDYPVVLITQDQAAEYCAFVGKRLPTEFEWERVAKGPAETRRMWPAEGLDDKWEDCITLGLPAVACDKLAEAEQVPEAGPSGDYALSYGINTGIKDYVLEGGKPVYHIFSNVSEWTSSKYVQGNTCLTELPSGCTPTYKFETLTTTNQCMGLCNRADQCDDWGADQTLWDPDTETSCMLSSRTGDPNNSKKCYYRCATGASDDIATPICGNPGGDVYTEADLFGFGDPVTDVVIKGGNAQVPTGSACSLMSSARDMYKRKNIGGKQTKVDNYVGFRCAFSGGSPPDGYPTLDWYTP